MTQSAMVEADLHGIVDGQIDAIRRADVLRRLAASPAHRAQVEAWQAQGDLLRSAFAGVDREPVPVMLELKARPQLHCVPADDAPLVTPIVTPRAPRNRIAGLAAAVIIAAGLAGSWVLLNQAEPDEIETATPAHGAADAALASRTAAALDVAPLADTPGLLGLPTTKIPNLRSAGFGLVGAETIASRPPTIVFQYRNRNAERVVLSVARSEELGTSAPTPIGESLTWRRGEKVYAIAGTMDRSHLRAIATTLQTADP